MRRPEFWETGGGALLPALLSPAAALYSLGGAVRQAAARPYRAPVLVLCAGGLTVGGSGKTPVALALAAALKERGLHPHFLTRGYGGSARGPLRVDAARHTAVEVGDEPLLLTAVAPCWVCADRAAAARAAIAAGADVLVMDDGLQNPGLRKDLPLLVIDGTEGFGNGRVLPAGPLREPVNRALARSAAVVLVGPDAQGIAGSIPPAVALVHARLALGPEVEALAGRRVLAFAGIARPEKFFAALRARGVEVVRAAAFPDHHRYGTAEAQELLAEAEALHALAVTTAKDVVRFPVSLRDRVAVVTVELLWNDPDAVAKLLRIAGIP